MKCIVATAPHVVVIEDLPQPKPGPYQALVRTKVASLCNATDRKLIAGHFPGVDKFPMVLGHEGAGVVEEVGAKVKTFRVGDHAIGGMVFDFGDPKMHSGWGGFCEYTIINDHDAMLADGVADDAHGWFEAAEIQRNVDADIPFPEAVLLCTWREVLAAFGDFHLQRGQRILIFGAGPVGLSFVKFARLLGLEWIGVVEPNTARHAKIVAMGADEVFLPDDVASLKSRNKPLDAVIDAVGNTAIVNTALPLVKLGGSVCIYGVLGENTIPLDKSLGPYNFNIFVHQWPTRFREREAQRPLCDWIRSGKLRADEFVTHTFPSTQIADALAAGKTGNVIKCLLTF
ncbi:MAG: zinc-dependent alcohol dehydrogenase [Thermoguttaceae bacterium]